MAIRLSTLIVLLLIAVIPASAQTAAGGPVTGVVQDQTGAVLPGARVELLNPAGTTLASTSTDGVGTFRFDNVSTGQYQIRAQFEGFAPLVARVRVGGRGAAGQKLVLGIAGLKQEITVSDAADVGAASTTNVDAVSVDTSLLGSLPVFDNDLIATMSRFLDTGSLGNGGVTIVVNGMEVNALNVSASAVQQIRINQDPYSAEYSRPGRGRVEILTRPGDQQYHGDITTIVRDARVNARNPFATAKPPEERRLADGFFGGRWEAAARRRSWCRPTTRSSISRPSSTRSDWPA